MAKNNTMNNNLISEIKRNANQSTYILGLLKQFQYSDNSIMSQ